MIFIFLIGLALSFLFDYLGFNEANIILVFTLSVLLTAQFTDFFIYSFISSLIVVPRFNFFFIEPRYSFNVYDADYLITFFIMLMVTLMASILTNRIKRIAAVAKVRENRMKFLYESNKHLLLVQGQEPIVNESVKNLARILKRDVAISRCDENHQLLPLQNYSYSLKEEASLFLKSLSTEEMAKVISSDHDGLDPNLQIYYYPILGKNDTLGVIAISLINKDKLDENEMTLLQSLSTQIAFALERERLYEQHKQANLEAERERLRGNLLRSISHDLKTPLTSILGSTSTLIQNNHIITEEIRLELLNNIYDETTWLQRSIENILSMTKIDEGRLELDKHPELLEELITEAVTRIQRFHPQVKIVVDIEEEMVFLNVDAVLIETVLVNLPDNAVHFSKENQVITVRAYPVGKDVCFQVIDEGRGISEEDLPFIFDRFYTKGQGGVSHKKGIGLGLTICKSIVQAHHGTITVFNNVLNGCTFEFLIPMDYENGALSSVEG